MYIGLEGLYVSAVAFKFNDVAASAASSDVPLWVFLVALALMLTALALTARAVAVETWEGLALALPLAEKLEVDPQSEEAFLLDRCHDYSVSASTNSDINDTKANRLEKAGWFIFAAIGVHGAGILWGIGKSLICTYGG